LYNRINVECGNRYNNLKIDITNFANEKERVCKTFLDVNKLYRLNKL